MKKLMMIAACAAMMTANATSANPDIGVRMTGAYIAEGCICVTTSKAIEELNPTYHLGFHFECEEWGLLTCEYAGIGEHSVALPTLFKDWDITEDITINVYEHTDETASHHLVTRLGVIHKVEGTWWSWGQTGDLVYGLPEVTDDDGEDEEPIVEPEPEPATPTKTIKCPVLSFFRKILGR